MPSTKLLFFADIFCLNILVNCIVVHGPFAHGRGHLVALFGISGCFLLQSASVNLS